MKRIIKKNRIENSDKTPKKTSKTMQFLKGFKQGIHTFGYNISTIVNSAILLLVYILVVGPLAITAKITGKKFLKTKFAKDKTYWTDLNIKKQPLEKYYKQF